MSKFTIWISVAQYYSIFLTVSILAQRRNIDIEDKPKEQKPVLESLQSKTTLCSAVAQLSFSCRAQLFHCCWCTDFFSSELIYSRFSSLPILEKKREKHLAISQTPTQSQWSTETWLVGHLTSASNCGKLLDLLCNCWKFCSHTSELSTFVLNIKNIFTIKLFIMLLMYIDTMDFKSNNPAVN